MARQVPIFSGATGINNVIDPVRLPFDPQAGVGALEDAVDFIIDRTGALVTRPGIEKVGDGFFHSLFPSGDVFYAVKDRDADSALYVCRPGPSGQVSLDEIGSGFTIGRRFDYWDLGDGRVFFVNGAEHGFIFQDQVFPWPENDWPGPESNADFRQPPPGEHLAMISGRFLISQGSLLYYTEYGLPGLVDMARNVARFESKIRMIAPVSAGVFVSDERAIYFLAGSNPPEWTRTQVAGYPAIEWGVLKRPVHLYDLGIDAGGVGVLMATERGPAVGLPDGGFLNLIDKQLQVDQGCSTAAIELVDQTLIIQAGE